MFLQIHGVVFDNFGQQLLQARHLAMIPFISYFKMCIDNTVVAGTAAHERPAKHQVRALRRLTMFRSTAHSLYPCALACRTMT